MTGDLGVGVGNTLSTASVAGAVVQAGSIGTVTFHHHHAAAPRPVPRQLSAPQAGFVGRAAALAALDATSDRAGPGRSVVSTVGGVGGIGKTWLVLHWAHTRIDRFPDGQLFVDLQGFSPAGQPMDPAVAVRGFLDALGVDSGRIPADPHAQAALYRSHTADRRMLIVLDNAATSDQVVPLLPGGHGCTVLITSRDHLRGLTVRHGARPIRLDLLTDTEAHALLTTTLGPDRDAWDAHAVAEVTRMCGGYPLALGLVAARAAAAPHLGLADIVPELRDLDLDALDSDDPTASLPAVLSWSLHRLTDRQRQVFALLGIAPGPDIGLPAAACLAGLSDKEGHAVLRALTEVSLIDRIAGGRYRMHDLVRAYATGIAADLDQHTTTEALRRVLDCYTHTAATAARCLDPHATPIPLDSFARGCAVNVPITAESAVGWFDNEYPCLLAAQHHAAAVGRHHTAWCLAWATHLFQSQRGHLRDRLAVLRIGLDATRKLDAPVDQARALRYLGYAYGDLALHDEAAQCLDQALATAESARDPVNQAHTHRALALAWAQRGDDRRALEHADRALTLHGEFDNPVQTARTHNTAGHVASRLGHYDTARKHHETALTLQRRHDDHFGETDTLVSLGALDHLVGRHRHAIDHYEEAVARLRVYGSTYFAAYALDGLGHPHAALGHHDQARAVWQEALKLYQAQGRDADAARVQQQLDDLDDTQPPQDTETAG
ncbi:MAG: tetratricopeptide repeat protein [Saccharothrix sp.]|nr:tetratricopeptide repeat protein [Saccharothrix sp.]